GHGRYGYVQDVKSKLNGGKFACKVMRIVCHNKHQITRMMQSEIAIVSRLRHPHVVKMYGSYTTPKECGMILLPIAEGTLEDLLRRWSSNRSWQEAKKHVIPWLGCLSSAVAYIHSMGVKHKDIKPSNILYKGHQIYLADFGLSVQFDPQNLSTSSGVGGTPAYTAPEAMVDGKRGRSADIFSLGCVFMEM
ncbi:kinase-like domain-containing protein, partial [Lophiotrema nucula]